MEFSLLFQGLSLLAGLAGLWFVGDRVVHYTIATARAFNVTTFFIGFALLSLAADIPELAVSIVSAFNDVTEIAAGDIIGANFCDVAFVIGIALLIAGTVTLKEEESKRLVAILGLASLVLLAVFSIGTLYPIHGVMLIGIYLTSLLSLWYRSKKQQSGGEAISHASDTNNVDTAIQKEHQTASTSLKIKLVTQLCCCLAAIMTISYLTMELAVDLAKNLHLPLETIGATIFGVGTSLPELVLSLGALRRKEYSLALGTTLGTVLEQTTLILGTLTVLSPKPVCMNNLWTSSLFMFLAFMIISYGLYLKSRVGRSTGIALVTLFFAYLAYQATQTAIA